jgi:hypothetical protein
MWMLLIGGFAVLLGSSSHTVDGIATGMILVALAAALIWFLRCGWSAAHYFNQQLTVAATPVMSPQEINQRFINDQGREPTIEEVAAIQQMLRNEHNDALVRSGIGIGALLFIGRSARL